MINKNSILVFSLLFIAHTMFGMNNSPIFTEQKAYATQELEDQARAKIKKDHLVEREFIPLGMLAGVTLGLCLTYGIDWPRLFMGNGLMGTLLVYLANREVPEVINRTLQAKTFFNNHGIHLKPAILDSADNVHRYNIDASMVRLMMDDEYKFLFAHWNRRYKKRLFDGSYYEEYTKTIESLLKRYDIPKDIASIILCYAGFDRYKPAENDSHYLLTERDILDLTDGHMPIRSEMRGSEVMNKFWKKGGDQQKLYSVISGYKKYAFLHKRGWVTGDQKIFSPKYLDREKIKKVANNEQALKIYSTETYGPYFNTPNPKKFAELYAFEKDERYKTIVDKLAVSGAEKDTITQRRRKIYNTVKQMHHKIN